ncbi:MULTISPECIES: iron transporter [Treponema]|uniref:34 kDa membrane antigen n=6 Tax=Treponema TaxID=157 RepID=TA34_TREPA|nr:MULTISPECIES: iron transporter [Treponema]P19478.1 RecName: Full=34 kDa membrane antigen; AltName: Full=Pathogen-specific membrane antigen; Flags: Precursor [Treponema pallidum subsp. pallidum str. Nichols]AAA27474.1 34 kd antigen precursor [Treponema pallidum]AAC65921.1 membrane antigen, pathogen-specific (tpd) [Treponema pallidum subsp. pallidum str. Nichols]ACD71387.1 membrane antigen, pathogen-specific [Treponema pallidum subsp. pallidum SS14]ADD73060.1 34 kDa membrane antigen [Treponem
MKRVSLLGSAAIFALVFSACGGGGEHQHGEEMMAAVPAPDAEGAAGFDEFPIGEDRDVGPLHVGGVYFQPVEMHPAPGAQPSKEEADCHIEADIHANEAGKDLGYGVGDFVPYLRVVAFLQKHGSEKVQKVMFAPMNAGDGPHYGANVKFEEGLGTYKVRFEIAAPSHDEYSLHIDEQTGVSGRFWSEPLVAEWDDFEWKGPQW